MPSVRHIGTNGPVDLEGFGTVAPGQIIQVPAEGAPGTVFAGRRPAARVEKAHLELAAAIADHDHPRAAELREEIVGLEPGSGLLAQTANWEAVKAPAAEKPSTSTTTSEVSA